MPEKKQAQIRKKKSFIPIGKIQFGALVDKNVHIEIKSIAALEEKPISTVYEEGLRLWLEQHYGRLGRAATLFPGVSKEDMDRLVKLSRELVANPDKTIRDMLDTIAAIGSGNK